MQRRLRRHRCNAQRQGSDKARRPAMSLALKQQQAKSCACVVEIENCCAWSHLVFFRRWDKGKSLTALGGCQKVPTVPRHFCVRSGLSRSACHFCWRASIPPTENSASAALPARSGAPPPPETAARTSASQEVRVSGLRTVWVTCLSVNDRSHLRAETAPARQVVLPLAHSAWRRCC